MRAPKQRNAFKLFFSHVFPLSDHGFSMAPPSWKQMERKKSSERNGYHLLSNIQYLSACSPVALFFAQLGYFLTIKG